MIEQSSTTPTPKRSRKMAREPGQTSLAESTTASGLSPSGKRANKTSLVLDLLGRPEGATIAQLIDATGWLPHTTRAALTGLRKKGHAVMKNKQGDVTCYRIAGEVAA